MGDSEIEMDDFEDIFDKEFEGENTEDLGMEDDIEQLEVSSIEFSKDEEEVSVNKPTEPIGFKKISVKNLSEIASKVSKYFSISAMMIKDNQAVVSSGYNNMFRKYNFRFKNNFQTEGEGVLTIDWEQLQDELNDYFNNNDIISFIYEPEEEQFVMEVKKPYRKRVIEAVSYSPQYIIETPDWNLDTEDGKYKVGNFILDVEIDIKSADIKQLTGYIKKSKSDIEIPVFPLELIKDGDNYKFFVKIDNPREHFEAEILPENVSNPYNRTIKSYYRDGFEDIISGTSGIVSIKYNEDSPMLLFERDKEYVITTLLSHYIPK
jgi:hypothetical protein